MGCAWRTSFSSFALADGDDPKTRYLLQASLGTSEVAGRGKAGPKTSFSLCHSEVPGVRWTTEEFYGVGGSLTQNGQEGQFLDWVIHLRTI
jgi:hypothetical protein